MKIGILTYHAVYNFGANLQALSTYSYLKNAGYNPVIIDFFPEKLEETFDKHVPVVQANAHKSYLLQHFILTKRCRNASDIAKEIIANNIEAIIIGSDAVVQHNPFLARIRINPSRKTILSLRIDPVCYETNYPNPFWGEFLEHLDNPIPVAMMSVSCQDTDYKLIIGGEKKGIGHNIEKLNFISVRDNRTQELFKHVSGGKCIPNVTPDPVFAFNDNILNLPDKNKILQKFKLPEKYFLLSFNSSRTVSKSWVVNFESIANQSGYQCVAFTMPGGIKFDNSLQHKIDIPIDPLDWYCLIKYSSAYIGEKMHPVIVALHNSVPFFCFDHYGILRFKLFQNQRASKIYQILEKANLQDYRISTIKKISYKAPTPEFVYEKIQSIKKDDLAKFADQMRNEYKIMMRNLMHELQY
ncbi:MAG: polysaccharide pyruvyl transferase family protein [Bacteroidales bacterium]